MIRTVCPNQAIEAYFKNSPSYCEPYGNGHINDTFLVITDKRYILQRMNTVVFPCPVELMENILGVTEHIRKKVAKSGKNVDRATLRVVPTLTGENYFVDKENNYWRLYDYVEGSVTFEKVESALQFYRCAVAFGNFQRMLADYPAHTLNEVIANFHNTPDRYKKLMAAVERDELGRLAGVEKWVEFIKEREDFLSTLENAYKNGDLPLRVTHNDTKLNNILFDETTGEPVCAIDLDTVMPGYSVVDFGDSIRFGANHAAEDERDISKIYIDLELFKAYAKGFLEGCNGSLTETETDLLAVGAVIVTLECGMRFLTDYLEGDVYFKTKYETHNLDRAVRQFVLATDMENKLEEMKNIVNGLK